MSNTWCIVANGTPCAPALLANILKTHQLCVCDGAMEWLQAHGFPADALIGDMDSITPHTLEHLKHHTHCKIIHDPNQHSTDCEKAFLYCLEQGATHITLLAATGERMDHTLYHLHLIKRFASNTPCHIELRQANERLQYISSGTYLLTSPQPHLLSILGFPSAIIGTAGLQYNVESFEIDTYNGSISNQLVAQQGTLHIQGHALLITHPNILVHTSHKQASP